MSGGDSPERKLKQNSNTSPSKKKNNTKENKTIKKQHKLDVFLQAKMGTDTKQTLTIKTWSELPLLPRFSFLHKVGVFPWNTWSLFINCAGAQIGGGGAGREMGTDRAEQKKTLLPKYLDRQMQINSIE
jgi:hypothetical protein